MSQAKGVLLVISGASGVGKSTVIRKVLQTHPALYFSISHTTRAPRPGETDGVHYHFVDRDTFEAMIQRGAFLEYAEYVGNYYGTSLAHVQEKLDQGVDVLLDIEVQGAAKVKEIRPDAALVFLLPPSFEELTRRLHARKTDDEEKIQRRLQRAKEEYQEVDLYDYLVINDQVENAGKEILAIIQAEHCRTPRRRYFVEGV